MLFTRICVYQTFFTKIYSCITWYSQRYLHDSNIIHTINFMYQMIFTGISAQTSHDVSNIIEIWKNGKKTHHSVIGIYRMVFTEVSACISCHSTKYLHVSSIIHMITFMYQMTFTRISACFRYCSWRNLHLLDVIHRDLHVSDDIHGDICM